MTRFLTGVALAALFASAPALAETSATKKMTGQPSAEQPANSGPGVQGPPDTRTGPSTRAPEGSANEGASTGDTEHTTTPSQDSSGVEGLPGNKSGRSLKEPGGEKTDLDRESSGSGKM